MKSLHHRIIIPFGQLAQKYHAYLAAGMLVVMFALGLVSMRGNSAIVDEVAHIPAAYSYLHYGDYRLNPEHPPLIKDLAGLPLQFMHLKFPVTEPSWTTNIPGQWAVGWSFLYYEGNNLDSILFWARLPILLLGVAFGAVLYLVAKKRFGIRVALLALFFYALSPNIIANSTFVTTDLGATVFIFLAIAAFARFVDRPNRSNFILFSLGLAAAQLAKFSAVLLYPFLGLMSVILVLSGKKVKDGVPRLKRYFGGFLGASALSGVWIWLFYIPHTINMSVQVQDKLIHGVLKSNLGEIVANFFTGINTVPLIKPAVQYLLGLTMVFSRVQGGNVTYFNGQVKNGSFLGYFPEIFTLKTQVALVVLMLAGLGFVLWKTFGKQRQGALSRFPGHLRSHVFEWSLGMFAVFYLAVSMGGNLNLGIRHILPIYMPVFVLTAISSVAIMRRLAATKWRKLSMIVFGALLSWYGVAAIVAYPNYLSYFNEFIGGSGNSGKYFSDSSVDWGQDLRRLKTYTQTHPEVSHLAIDYFGGGLPEYYFCVHKQNIKVPSSDTSANYDCSYSIFEPWHSQYGPYTGQYIAVSETFLENDRYYAALKGQPGYGYLRAKTPIAKIGNSIYLFKLY